MKLWKAEGYKPLILVPQGFWLFVQGGIYRRILVIYWRTQQRATYEVQQRFFASWEGLERLEAAGEVAVQGELIGTEIQAPEIGD